MPQEKVLRVLSLIGEPLACPADGTRLRFGDYECPQCGEDLDDHLRRFAERIVDCLEDPER